MTPLQLLFWVVMPGNGQLAFFSDHSDRAGWQLGQDGKNREGYTEAIKNFSEQAYSLALNAMIEAVRNGETGREFLIFTH